MKKIFSVLALLSFAAALHAEVNFIKQPEWKDILAKAKAEHKYIFVDAYTDWCIWCKVMDKQTFPEQEVSDLLNNKFIPVKMEMETGYGTTLAMKYHVANFPTFLVFNSDGQLVDRLLGYQKTKEFMGNLDKSLNSLTALNGFSPEVEMAYPDFYKKAFIKNEKGKRTMPDSATVLAYLDGQKDLTTEINWSVLSRFSYMTRKYDSFVLNNSEKLKGLYGKQETDHFISSIINSGFSTAVTNKDEKMLRNNVFAMIDKYQPEDAAAFKANYEIAFYTGTEDYTKMIETIVSQVKQKGYADMGSTINSACWTIYEKSKDEYLISKSVELMKEVTNREPLYAYLDTYAAVLYKAGRVADAEKYAQMAIDEGKKSNDNTKSTEELLAKMKAEATK